MILVHGVTINKKGGITVESILTSIKLLLGITEDYDYFDAQIITHINSVFMILTQLGVGPPERSQVLMTYCLCELERF